MTYFVFGLKLFDESGGFYNLYKWTFEEVTKINNHFYFAVLLFVIALIPQAISYIISIPWGVSKPLFAASFITEIIMWGLAKGFSTAAGCFLSFVVFIFFTEPPDLPDDFSKLKVVSMSFLLQIISCGAIMTYYKLLDFIERIPSKSFLGCIHKFATRNIPDGEVISAPFKWLNVFSVKNLNVETAIIKQSTAENVTIKTHSRTKSAPPMN